jgi:hypothetical protein
MKLQANYDHTYQYVRKNARGLTYDIGYQVYQRNDSSFIYGFEVVQEASDGRFGSGASALNFDGTREEAEARVRELVEQQIENLPEEYESERFRNRKETDEGAVTDGWLIRRIYGYWPLFHDAELLSVTLRQYAFNGKRRTDMELVVHHSGQDNPEWEGRKVHCKLRFLFEDVQGNEFATHDISDPSWINDLRFSKRADGRVEIDLEPSTGFSILLNCAAVRLASVEPYSGETF